MKRESRARHGGGQMLGIRHPEKQTFFFFEFFLLLSIVDEREVDVFYVEQ